MITFQHQHGKHSRRTNGWTLRKMDAAWTLEVRTYFRLQLWTLENERRESTWEFPGPPWKWKIIIFQSIMASGSERFVHLPGGVYGESWCEKPLDFRGVLHFKGFFTAAVNRRVFHGQKMDLTAKLVRRKRVQNRSEGISEAPGVVNAFPKGTKKHLD